MADSDAATKSDLLALQTLWKGDLLQLQTSLKDDLLRSQTLLLRHLESFEERILARFTIVDQKMDQKIDDLRMEMLERIERSETSLLSAFQVWAVPVNGRIRKLELGDANLGERLAAIEDRLMNLERRQFPGSNPGATH